VVAAAHRPGDDSTLPVAFMIAGSACGCSSAFAPSASALAFLPSTTLWRMCTSRSGSGIRTGQTSKHAPHRVEAYGREASTGDVTPRNCGVSTEPIGPG